MKTIVIPNVTVNWYCRCGAKLKGVMPKGLADALLAKMVELHQGDGHGPATPQQASRARVKAEKRNHESHE